MPTEIIDTPKGVTFLPNNTTLVNSAAGSILVNCPPETLKLLLSQGLEPPDIILLPPDIPIGQHLGSSGFVYQGVNYASVEFLIYANYFMHNGKKTRLITITCSQAERIKRILQETLIGPADTAEYYPYPWVRRECQALAFHPPLGRSIEIDDVCEITCLERGGGALENDVTITYDGKSFHFHEQGALLASLVTDIVEPAMPLTLTPPRPVQRQEITLQFIGGSDGFDPDGITTCFLAYFGATGQDKATLFDAAAYLRVRLGNLGISPNQISEIVISHLHEDHIAGLPELILMGGFRLRLITSYTIYRSLLRVLSAILAVPQEDISVLIDYYPLQPGQSLILDGKIFEAIYGIHTIPTLAVKINGLYYSGDMRYDEAWFEDLEKEGILSPTRRGELVQFAEGASIMVQDAGGGTIHTNITPEVLISLATKSNHIVFTHTRRSNHNLPAMNGNWDHIEFADDGHVTGIGKLLPYRDEAEKLETISACPLYARLSIAERGMLAQNCALRTCQSDEILLQPDAPPDGWVYVLHKGLIEIIDQGKRVRVEGRGASIGECEALTGQYAQELVRAYGNAQLLAFSPELFESLTKRLGLKPALARVERLSTHPLFRHLPWTTLLDLALDFQPMSMPTGRLLFEYGSPGYECYLLISGAITIFDQQLAPLGEFTRSGEFFGGRSVLFGGARNSYACISQDSEIWALPAPALHRFQYIYPSVILHLRAVEAQRHGSGPLISALGPAAVAD